MTLRVLGGIRLSRLTDESTSPARQREVIETWTGMHQGELVHVAEDLDVSGAVSPWERPELGPWLTDPERVARWDVLVVWKLDRLSRSALDTLKILRWVQDHDKRVVAVDDSLDSSSQMGRAWMQMSAVFAELDLNTMKERITATRTHLRKMGRWVGGQVPYGYRPVKDEDGYHLEHDPETAPVVREIVERVLLGHSVNGIARDLTDRKVPPPRAGEKRTRWREETGAWSAPAITAILRSPALRGWVRYKGKPVLGPDGLPRSMGPELVTAGEWELVQEALEARSKQRRAPRDAGHAPLFGVVHCACGSHMVSGRSRGGERRYVCLRARRTPGVEPCPVGGTIMGPPVEEFAEEQFLAMFGGLRVVEYRKIPGQDFSAEIRELEASLQRLDEAYQAGAYEGDVATYATMRKGVRAKLEDLRAQPTTEARTEEVDHGVTYGLMWELATDAEERRKLMLDCHFRVWVGPRVRQGRVSRDEVRARLSAGIAEEALLEPEDFSE